MEAYSLDEIREHNSEESAWLLHKGRVFDVTKFISHHPGGRNVLLPKFGSDVTEIMQDTQIHKHTAFAFNMMNKYCIGKLSGQVEIYKYIRFILYCCICFITVQVYVI
jgi:4-hydroxysphinganine ceramide fatty acyl 2-hydroxylase